MPAIIDLLAEDFAGRSVAIAQDPEIRVLITAGILMPFVAVYAVLAADDVVYLELG